MASMTGSQLQGRTLPPSWNGELRGTALRGLAWQRGNRRNQRGKARGQETREQALDIDREME